MTATLESWQLLKRIAVAEPGAEAAAESALAAGAFDHDALIGQAMRHALCGTVAAFVAGTGRFDALPRRTTKQLSDILWSNRLAAAAYVDEAASIQAALLGSGVRFAFTKGIICHQRLYGGTGARAFYDIDLMVHPEDVGGVAAALPGLGYEGEKLFDYRTGRLERLPRKTALLYRMFPDHLPHYTKVNAGGLPRVLRVDVAFSLTWHGSEWDVPVEAALGARREYPVGEAGLVGLDPVHDLLFHVLHLFREGWFERTVRDKDVRLSQFADVARAWHALPDGDRQAVRRLVAAYGIELPVAWVAGHLDGIFDAGFADALGVAGSCDPDWLSSMRGADSFYRWHGDMDRRLREPATTYDAAKPPALLPQLP